MRLTPAIELEHRCKRLQEIMQRDALDAVIIVQNADLFYFTGTIQNGFLFVPSVGQPLYLVRKDYMRARMESGLKEIIPVKSIKDILPALSDFSYQIPQKIGMELDVLPVTFFDRYRKIFPDSSFSDATPAIREVRMIKSHYEIHIAKDAADLVYKVNQHASSVIKEGITDLDLAAELEYTARKNGHQGLIRMRSFNSELFYAQIFSGTDTAVPSYCDTPLGGMGLNPSFGQSAGLKRIERNEPIIVDFGGCIDGYIVDQTRIFSIGELPEKLANAYSDMREIKQFMLETAKPGMSWGKLYNDCCSLAIKMGYAENFMGYGNSQVSFIGHGVGVEIDEYPFIARGFDDKLFEAGMTFAFEPKVVFPGIGAIGIEDTFYFSNDGLKQLTYSEEDIISLSI